jgi:hypothetical protein
MDKRTLDAVKADIAVAQTALRRLKQEFFRVGNWWRIYRAQKPWNGRILYIESRCDFAARIVDEQGEVMRGWRCPKRSPGVLQKAEDYLYGRGWRIERI